MFSWCLPKHYVTRQGCLEYSFLLYITGPIFWGLRLHVSEATLFPPRYSISISHSQRETYFQLCCKDKMALTSSALWWNEWEIKYVPCLQTASSPESNRETQKLSQLVIKWGPRLRGFFCYCCLAKYELENFLGIKLSRMYGTPNKGIYRKVGENFSSHVPGASSEFYKTTSSQKLSPTMLRWLRTKRVPRGGDCSGFEEQR